MPRWLRGFLRAHPPIHHLLWALLAGLLVRAASAYFVYGPQALDDYKHGVWPAYQHFAGLPLDLPAYRSPLLVWFLSGFVRVASWFGVDTALGQVRAMYLGLGLTSLLGICGTYLYGRTLRSRLAAGAAVYLVALFPLLPFIGTRAFGEAVAMSLVALGFGILEYTRHFRKANVGLWTLGFLVLGVATLFRFHVGLLFLTYGAILIGLRLWPGVVGAGLAGLGTLALQAAVDIVAGKAAFATLFIYLSENEGGAAKYGVSPWYNPLLFVLGISLAPFSLVLWRAGRGLWRRAWVVLVPFLVFLVAHSLVPHKEERFLYPILILEFWALAYLWSASALRRAARRIFTPALLILGTIGLLVVSLVNTQEGEIEPPAYLQSHYGKVIYLDHDSLFGRSRFQFYFLRPPSVLEKIPREEFNAHRVDTALEAHPDLRAAALLTSDPQARDELRALEGMQTLDSRCGEVREAGSVVDRLLYKMNPKHNQRRKPTWYLVCERI